MEPPSSFRISVLDSFGCSLNPVSIERAVCETLRRQGISQAEVCVLLTSDEHVATLNGVYRSVPGPTDVLTFGSGEGADGDIAIAIPFATAQAEAHGIDLSSEVVLLAIHGALHLAGFDDQTEAERRQMIGLMDETAVELGLKPIGDWASHHPSEEVA